MSGGVDSSVAAALLVKAGYDCVGMTMRVASGEGRESSDKACCTLDAAQDARRVCDTLGIPHYVVNYIDRFEREVISDFIREYQAGRTPNPCSRCNQRVKFGALYEKAMAVEADYIATGHYVRRAEINGRVALRRGLDTRKDQSYTLAGLGQDQLRRALFPVGEHDKSAVREIARDLGLVTADKPESQEICFVPDDNYRNFLVSRLGAPKPGPIVTTLGEVLGTHKGLMYYTIGQRRGIDLAAERPLYVVRIDVDRNALVVGFEEETYCRSLSACEVTWSGNSPGSGPFDCLVQLRAHHNPAGATVSPCDDGFRVDFHEPERSVTPGQWAVLYDKDGHVLAGGIIETFESCAARASLSETATR
ncbi:MAG: tRNA-specific 2-thiouridylase MnmA [Candidatus Hydrogenedentota bacterium]